VPVERHLQRFISFPTFPCWNGRAGLAVLDAPLIIPTTGPITCARRRSTRWVGYEGRNRAY